VRAQDAKPAVVGIRDLVDAKKLRTGGGAAHVDIGVIEKDHRDGGGNGKGARQNTMANARKEPTIQLNLVSSNSG